MPIESLFTSTSCCFAQEVFFVAFEFPDHTCYHFFIQNRINNQIIAKELRVIGETGDNLGVMKREDALALAKEKSLDLIEIAPMAQPPVARIMSFDKFRYQQGKEERKQRNAQKQKELKQVQITPRSALNDLQIKARKAEDFLNDGHKVTISLFLRGREKANKEWALKKMREFINMITVSHEITMEPKQGGRGFLAQIVKK
ncbi:MAG: translation initiation factor IF-3 [Minisyncoccia bacterium]